MPLLAMKVWAMPLKLLIFVRCEYAPEYEPVNSRTLVCTILELKAIIFGIFISADNYNQTKMGLITQSLKN